MEPREDPATILGVIELCEAGEGSLQALREGEFAPCLKGPGTGSEDLNRKVDFEFIILIVSLMCPQFIVQFSAQMYVLKHPLKFGGVFEPKE